MRLAEILVSFPAGGAVRRGVALVTHSTKPRGGLVHTLSLAEALHRRGEHVHLVALGDPAVGLFRPTDVPHTVLPGPAKAGTTLDERVFAAIDTLTVGLRELAGNFDILHTQDCIAARAAARVRDGVLEVASRGFGADAAGPVRADGADAGHGGADGADAAHGGADGADAAHPASSARVGGIGTAGRTRGGGASITVLRTVHHVDDFTTPALIDCQRQAIVEPDRVLVVSEQWRAILRDEYATTADVVPNGVDLDRFPAVDDTRRRALRARIGAQDRFLFLAVGGVEPRKGSIHAFRALAHLRRELDPPPMLAVIGGHSFQDYTAYRDAALAALPELGLALGRAEVSSGAGIDGPGGGAAVHGDVVLLGTVSEAELGGWYAAADALAFPSLKEGWGLVVLEAMNAGLPVVASDLPVFAEYLTDGESALLPPVADERALADAMHRLVVDGPLRDRLRVGGRAVLPRFTWDASAARHQQIYTETRATAAVC